MLSIPLYGITLKDFPTSRVGTWKSEFKYFYPTQTVEVKTELKITHSDDQRQLIVSAYSKSESFGDSEFSYYVDLIPDEHGKHSYQFMSTTGQKEKGSIEVIDPNTTKVTFSSSSGYAISKIEVISETVIIGEEKTYDAEGNFLFKATFRNELTSYPERN